jgi:tetratricopeptide (TPR) repeat protein
MAAMTSTPPLPWRNLAMIALVVLALYSRTFDFPFVNYDDNRYFYDNPQVTCGLSADSAKWAFGIHGPSMWIPLTWLSHQSMVSLFGVAPGPHHALNVLLHAANACLLLILLVRMTGKPGRASVVALVFAIHPLHVESVAWVTERKDVLSLLFCLLALMAYERHSRSKSWKWFPLVLFLHSMAVMAKPLAVTLPCVMMLCDIWPLRRGRPWLFLALEKLPLLLISAVASYLTVLCQQSIGAIGSAEVFPWMTRIGNALVAYATYVRRLFLPVDLAVFYPYPKFLTPFQWLLSALVVGSITYAAIAVRKKLPALLFGWLWFLGTLVPMIGLVQAGSAAMADRYAYFPFIGLYIAAVWCGFEYAATHRKPALAIGAMLLCGWIGLTWRQVGYWKSSEALFTRAIAVTPNNYLAHNNLGLALQDAGKIEEARAQFELSLRADPNYPEAINNLAILHARQGRPADARILLERLLAIRPDHATGWHNFGKVLIETGFRDPAIAAFRRAIQLSPDFIEPRYDLACVLMQGSEKAEAESILTDLTRAIPSHANAWVNLGYLRNAQGDAAGAETAYRNALAADPGNAAASTNLQAMAAPKNQAPQADSASLHQQGEAARKAGDFQKARQLFEQAIAADPANANAHNDLGVTFGQMGDHATAMRHFQQALAIDPKHPRAADNLRFAESMLKRK